MWVGGTSLRERNLDRREAATFFWGGGSTFSLEDLVSVTTSSVSTWDVKREVGRALLPASAWIFAKVNGRLFNSGSAEMEKPDTQRPRPGVGAWPQRHAHTW